MKKALDLSQSKHINVDGKTFRIDHTVILYKDRKAIVEIFTDLTEIIQMKKELQVKNVIWRG